MFSGWMGVLANKTIENNSTPKEADTVGNSVGTSTDNFLVIKSRNVINITAISA